MEKTLPPSHSIKLQLATASCAGIAVLKIYNTAVHKLNRTSHFCNKNWQLFEINMIKEIVIVFLV